DGAKEGPATGRDSVTVALHQRNACPGEERRQPRDEAVYGEEIEEVDQPDEGRHDSEIGTEELPDARLSLKGGEDKALFRPLYRRDMGCFLHPSEHLDGPVVMPFPGEEADRLG